MSLLDYLKEQLRARGWTMADLARAAAVSKQAVSAWMAESERERLTPSPASCEKIARALDVETDYLLELAGHRRPPAGDAVPDAVDRELRVRLRQMEQRLARYPRPFWAAVLDAFDRMATLGDALSAEPPHKAPPAPTNKSRRRALSGGLGAPGDTLTPPYPYPSPSLQPALAA